ncbi:MAG: hypothetical protein WAX77_13080 [Methylococcaceae bacterium]
MQQNTFNHVKTHFSETCHRIIEDHDILLVTQDDAENVVMMPQSLFDSWKYLLNKSSVNAVHQYNKQENSLKSLLASWIPLEEEFPEIEDLSVVVKITNRASK